MNPLKVPDLSEITKRSYNRTYRKFMGPGSKTFIELTPQEQFAYVEMATSIVTLYGMALMDYAESFKDEK